jgi:ferric-dicitrate binding protein FerR (iron transport regulator)
MSTDLTQAVADARQAETQAATIAQILAVVQAAQATAPAPAACSCSTHAPAPRRSAGKTAAWVAGGAACACVLTGMFLAVALVAVAVTVGGCIGYLLIREIRKGK